MYQGKKGVLCGHAVEVRFYESNLYVPLREIAFFRACISFFALRFFFSLLFFSRTQQDDLIRFSIGIALYYIYLSDGVFFSSIVSISSFNPTQNTKNGRRCASSVAADTSCC